MINQPSWVKGSQHNKKAEEETPVRFCLYARKSSESDERQALSIDSQIKEMLEYAKREKIEVQEILHESHSAKESWQRPVFNRMIEEIKAGKYNGIITWANDRLSRNAGDLGSLVDLMDDGLLTEIRTYNQKFSNSPNEKFLLMILGSQAKLENDNRGINAKRGMKNKCEMGYRPNLAPLGFINNIGRGTIRVDKKREPIIREIFERVAYQGYSCRKIFTWLDKIGFRTRKGKKISYSMVSRMLNTPYYCGLFEFPQGSGKWYKTKHRAIINRDLFNKVQQQIEIHPKTWPGTKHLKFTKLFKCGACGSGITGQTIKKNQNATKRTYKYYFCTKFRDLHCHQLYIREEELAKQLKGMFNKIPIEKLKSNYKVRSKIDELVKMVESIEETDEEVRAKLLPEDVERFVVKKYIKDVLESGDKQKIRDLVTSIDTTICIKDKKLYISKG